jgi:hypothetical protein
VNHRRLFAIAAAGVMTAGALLGASPASAHSPSKHTEHAKLRQLNHSGVSGHAYVTVRGKKLDVKIKAHGLLANAPHAVHIHYGEQARHECPTLADDKNYDGRLTTLEGVPAYGPVALSLTTKGDTSPTSALAIDRFSTAPKGKLTYKRTGIKAAADLRHAIRDNEAVIVVHGVDHNHNHTYDFSAGKSDLDPKLPAEATNPAACGVLHR